MESGFYRKSRKNVTNANIQISTSKAVTDTVAESQQVI